MTERASELPARYEPLARLGKGGGGEVWAVRDRHTRRQYALKLLDPGASEREMTALVREAMALSGLEGLGVPRVVRFGVTPGQKRPFMLRELVEGQSLDELIQGGAPLERNLESLARAAEQLTVLHRAGLLHGDVKPANIIVETSGRTTFVDLGLAAPWREGGTTAEGLTPRYAAPELFAGKPLTVRAEVYALGVALSEALAASNVARTAAAYAKELVQVGARSTAPDPSERFPSVDEFASALRRAAGLGSAQPDAQNELVWPIVGVDSVAGQLLEAAAGLKPGEILRVMGPPSSGRSALLRRLAWSLGVRGEPLAYVDDPTSPSLVSAEIEGQQSKGLFVLVDDTDALSSEGVAELGRVRELGARLVLVGGARFGEGARDFVVPALDERAAADLVRRALPSLTDSMLKRVVEISGGRPGELRRLVRLIASDTVASTSDIESKLSGVDVQLSLPDDALDRAVYFLDHGRFTEAKAALETVADAGSRKVRLSVALARLELGLGDAAVALERLRGMQPDLSGASEEERLQHALYLGRAHVGVGDYTSALEVLGRLGEDGALGAEALTYHGLALAFSGRDEEARAELERSVTAAETSGSARVESVALTCLAVAHQRSERNEEAGAAYQRAIDAAERASDAGMLATAQLNLAQLRKIQGDMARAIEGYEAAVDMGRRSGRRLTMRQALLNLANGDLYLGRLARARASIEALEDTRTELTPVMRAQLSGLQAELLARQGQLEQAVGAYDTCAAAFEALGRGLDAAESRLEAVLGGARAPHPDLAALRQRLNVAKGELKDTSAHRSLLLLASARVAELSGDDAQARRALDEALTAARETGQREWVWRTLEARASLVEAAGQPFMARRDREEALAVLEEIGARLPRDLREVYWNDPRRRQLRAAVPTALGVAATEFMPFSASLLSGPQTSALSQTPTLIGSGTSSVSQLSATPLEQKLSRILEVNSELASELDVGRLTARITEYAVELSRAERGFVLLEQPDGTLTVHTSRTREGDEAHEEFSRSIARRVLKSGEPVVAVDVRGNADMASFTSVHQMSLESVACVPIKSPGGKAIGALYLETRARRGAQFERELPTLRAFADQVAVALENARLIGENKRRADELSKANASLEEAQAKLRELLGDRTEQLRRTRQRLRDARETLYGHFGYQGLVGTSSAMRKVYALLDRIKDTDVPVLITGDSGTGKEMVARAMHEASPRAKAKMLGVNCGAIPENLLESELFGHVRGAFTGADRERKGLFRDCDGGTILLDEIGEMPTKMQSGLLRVLQERKVRPVGGNNEESVDVRLIFATNRDLGEMVKDGRFREDLYYRIHVVEVHLPALRERRDDIPQLVDHFLGIFAARYKREKGALTREAQRRLSDYDWPGNVRQLENVLLNAWVMSEAPDLLPEDFELPDGWEPGEAAEPALLEPLEPRETRVRQEGPPPRAERPPPPKKKGTVSEHRRDERERIVEALRACNWNRVKAAEYSGIPRRTFYRRLREYGIQ